MPNKTIAAFLNFVIWGAGYFYKGEKTVFATIMLGAYILEHAPLFYYGLETFTSFPGMFYPIAHVLISAALAYDVYKS